MDQSAPDGGAPAESVPTLAMPRFPHKWLVVGAVIVLVIFTGVRAFQFWRWTGMAADAARHGLRQTGIYGLVGTSALPFFAGATAWVWLRFSRRSLVRLALAAIIAGVASYGVAAVVMVLTKEASPEASAIVGLAVIGMPYAAAVLLPAWLYVWEARPASVLVLMGIAAGLLLLPLQPVAGVALFVAALVGLRLVSSKRIERTPRALS